jgi:hypothetical protein
MTGRSITAVRWGLVACAVVLIAGPVETVVVVLRSDLDRSLLGFLPVVVTYGAVGMAIVARRPGNAIGWIFVASGVTGSIGLLCKAIGTSAVPMGASAPWWAVWAGWLSLIYVELVSLPYLFLFLLFPDGHLLSRRWRWVAIAGVMVTTGSAVIVAVSDQNFARSRSGQPGDLNFPGMVHPLQLLPHEPAGFLYDNIFAPLSLAVLALSVVSLVVRYRRSRGAERQQLRWFLAASAFAVSVFVVTAIFWPDQITVAFSLLFPLIPVACGVAILQYHLYDIDRLISRTVSYVVVSGLALAVYVGVVSATTYLVPRQTSSWGVAVATLAAAAVFRPLLVRVRRAVDRRFDRRHVDAVAAAESFGRRVAERAEPDATVVELVDVVDETLAPVSIAVLLMPGPS